MSSATTGPPLQRPSAYQHLSHEQLIGRVCELAAANFKLRAKADRDGLILDSATDFAIVTLDLSGRITSWNTGAQRLLGHDESAVLGMSGSIVFTPEDRAAGVFVDELWKAFEHGSARNERWHMRGDSSRFWASGTMMPLLDTMGMVCGFLNIMRDATTVVEDARHKEFLLSEARHRAKNTFATVNAMVARHARSGGTLGTDFDARLAALARSHDLVDFSDVMLTEVIDGALAPYDDAQGQARRAGPPIMLSGRMAAVLNSILHELATNAAKYGGLSKPDGRVEVTWTAECATAGSRPEVVITWTEHGGPLVSPPSRRGFGTRVIEDQMSPEGGSVELDFEPQGVRCRIQLPPSASR